jgi:hypothetical protein
LPLHIDLIPGAARHFFAALAGQGQDLDDVAIWAANLSRCEDNTGEFAIAQNPIPRHLFCRKRHTVGR